jgi:DNA-binding GntR family transcriptional regulator
MDTTHSPAAESGILTRFLARSTPGLPKYAQLRETLLAAIEHGYWKPGARLPTEQALARHTPFSLGTVQRALRALVEEGIVVRLQGSGTYVADGRKPMDTPWHCRFLNDAGNGFLPIYPKVVSRKRIRERGPWSAYLGQRGDNVIRIDRTISVNDEFMVYSKFYLDAQRFGSMLTRPMAELDGANFKVILSREFGLPVTRFAQALKTMPFPEEICRAVKVKKGMVGTLLEIAAGAGRNRPVYYQELYVPPNARRLVIFGALSEGNPENTVSFPRRAGTHAAGQLA